MKLGIKVCRAPLRAPFVAAWGSVEARELLLVTVRHADGTVGFGEAAPLPGYDGTGLIAARAALEGFRAPLARFADAPRKELLSACRESAPPAEALCAIDLALWDLAAKRAGQPLWRLLGASASCSVEVNATITGADPAGVARDAVAAQRAGFPCVKVKVGAGEDARRIAAVRDAAGPQLAIRVDANGAWSPEQALAKLRLLEPIGVELCEEPTHGLEAIAAVARATPIPISIDETCALPGALDRRVCAAACLKLSRCGGVSGLLDAAKRARVSGYDAYLASTLDGPLGIAGALHAAMVIQPQRPSGLATMELFKRPAPALASAAGRMFPPPGVGLGDQLEAWYE